MELTKELVRKVYRDLEDKLYEACSRIRFDESLPEQGIATDLIFDSLRRIWDEKQQVKQVMMELDIWREQWEDEDDAV
jgi:hypothetical protein